MNSKETNLFWVPAAVGTVVDLSKKFKPFLLKLFNTVEFIIIFDDYYFKSKKKI